MEIETIRAAFNYFKTNPDVKEALIRAKIKPSPDNPVPTSEDYRSWKLGEWAGFLFKYITPKKS